MTSLKRSLVEPTDPPAKRYNLECTGIFASLPQDVMQIIINQVSENGLLKLRQTCLAFYSQVDDIYLGLRKKKCCVVDFTYFDKRNVANYYMTPHVISLFTFLRPPQVHKEGNGTRLIMPIPDEVSKKVALVCKNVPAFDALHKLLQLDKTDKITSELIETLAEDRIFSVIKDVYLFSRTMHILNGASKNKVTADKKKEAESDFDKTKIDIEALCDQGASYLAIVTAKIFYRFYLVDGRNKNEFATEFAVKLALKAQAKGDNTCYKHLDDKRVQFKNYVSELGAQEKFLAVRDKFLCDQGRGDWEALWKLDQWLDWGEIVSIFSIKQLSDVEIKAKNQDLQKLTQDTTVVENDAKLICAIFKFHLRSQNWQEANKLSENVLNATANTLKPSLFLVLAKMNAILGNNDKACQYYERIVPVYTHGLYNRLSLSYDNYETIITEHFEFLFNLKDWQRAENVMNRLLLADAQAFALYLHSGRYMNLQHLWGKFSEIKRHLNKASEADMLDAFHMLLSNNTPHFNQAVEICVQPNAVNFLKTLSPYLLIKLAGLLYVKNCYIEVDLLIDLVCQKMAFKDIDFKDQKTFVYTKCRLKKFEEAEQLWEKTLRKASFFTAGIDIKIVLNKTEEAHALSCELLNSKIVELLKAIQEPVAMNAYPFSKRMLELKHQGVLDQLRISTVTPQNLNMQSYENMVNVYLILNDTKDAYEIYTFAAQIYGTESTQYLLNKINAKVFHDRSM